MRLAFLAHALALVACGGEGQQETAAPDPGPSAAIATPPGADLAAIDKGQIPARYHGVWDAVTGTCDPDSDLRVAIEARRITFYESVGNVTAAGNDGADAIADLAMEGEGEAWFQSLRLAIAATPEGERLHLSDALTPKAPDNHPRKRCPA